MGNHLFLIGYRGTGKSSIGRRLGEKLGRLVVDSDEYVEREAGRSIRAIFAEHGESAFRDRESVAIQKIASLDEPSVVSLGGGAILRAENLAIIRSHGMVVWLKASIDEIIKRIADDASTAERRPALTQLAERDEIVKLLSIRQPIYAEAANGIFETDHRSIDDVASEIARWYSETNRTATNELAT